MYMYVCVCMLCVCVCVFVCVCVGGPGQSRARGLVAQYSKHKSTSQCTKRFTLAGWVVSLLSLYLLYIF